MSHPARGHAPSPVPALRRLIEQSLTVTDLAANQLWAVDPTGRTDETTAMLAARRFDVAGVAGDPITRFVTLDSLASSPGRLVEEVAQPIPASLCVEQSLPLSQLLEHFRTRDFVFALDRDHVRWVITRADLRAPAVSATILAYLVVIEEGLRRLVLDEAGDGWIGHLAKGRQSGIRNRFHDLATRQMEISLDLCANFGDWLKLGGKIDAVWTRLDFASRGSYTRATGSFDALRNDLAHGRSIFDTSGVDRGLDRIARIRLFADKVWGEVDSLDENWDLFARTVLEAGTSVLAGPNPVEVDWNRAVHVITAWNPGGAFWPEAENRNANDQLAELLESRGLSSSPVVRRSPDGRWSEESLLVEGCSRRQAVEIGAAFDQRAVFELNSEQLLVVRCPDGRVMRKCPRATL